MAKGKGNKQKQGSSKAGGPANPSILTRLLSWAPIALGVLFLVAGVSKAFDPFSFQTALGSYGVPEAFHYSIALVLPTVEIIVAIMLLANWGRRMAALASLGMLAVFVVSISYGWARGTLEECGCFGPLLERSPAEALLIDLLFVGMAAAVWMDPGKKPLPMDGWRPMLLGFVGLVGLAMTGQFLAAGPGGLGAITPSGGPDMRAVDLTQGEHLLYLFHYECPACAQVSPRVATFSRDPSLPPVVGVTFRTPSRELDNYRAKYGMDIPIEVLEGQAFVGITGDGSVPQLAFVRDGEIVRVWKGSNEIPGITELRRSLR